MKKAQTTIAALASLAIFSSLGFSANAQDKLSVGIVDMKRIFQEYGKTKDAEKDINEQKAKAKQELEERTAKYKELLEQFSELSGQVKDDALSPELREQKRKEATDKGQQAKSLERQIQDFRLRREKQLQEQVVRMRKTILDEIQGLVEEESKAKNYDMVFDKSGVSMNGVPFLMHSRDANDFSTLIIERLNKEAGTKAPAKPAETKQP